MLPDQFTSKVFFRFPLTQFLAVTPDAQLIVDPVFRPGHDVVTIACGVLSGTGVDGERVIGGFSACVTSNGFLTHILVRRLSKVRRCAPPNALFKLPIRVSVLST